MDDDKDEGDQTAVVKAVAQAKASLNQGLMASAHEGNPISAKFEMEDGKLQLSVYTMKADKFSEVAVDPLTGKVVNVEAITEGEDLAAAKAQSDAMKKAKRSLGAAVEEALKVNKGYLAVSVIPSLKDGHLVAAVGLAKGEEVKTVDEKLE
jgi:regulation of enolase protein 1 (concanavalin A-like superfamily)